MTTYDTTCPVKTTDADLVAASVQGNREAFGLVVERYQNLVSSLAYCATGNLSTSEDLAQETFVTAWTQLAQLREPAKLRVLALRGIARNLLGKEFRRQTHEPTHEAESLESVGEWSSPEPLPGDRAISEEEKVLLWRALELVPEIYREPLVLFYREHQSVEAVARDLDLTEDAVKQRLARGRKMVQEQLLAFVAGALERTPPGKTFAANVAAALPAMTLSSKASLLAASAAKGSSAKTAGLLGFLSLFLGPLLVIFPNYLIYRAGLAGARSEAERNCVKSFYRKITLATLALFVPFAAIMLWGTRHQADHSYLSGLFATALAVIFVPLIWLFGAASKRQVQDKQAQLLAQQFNGVFPPPVWEFRTRWTFLGWPLIHIRIGDRFSMLKGPVKAWVAIGDRAVGGLFAFGAACMAPVSIGGFSIGLVALGGAALGIFSLGGIAAGVWALYGGLVVGWQSTGCLSVAWNAAAGDFVLARHYGLGRMAWALNANDAVASHYINGNWFFQTAACINHYWWAMIVLAVLPSAVLWIISARRQN